MAVYKNKASQKVAVFAVDADGAAKTGDAAQITAQISKDGAATAATNDTNPTELDATDAPGIYLFDLTQAETNADLVVIAPVSSTSGITLRPVLIYTEPEIRSAAVASVANDAITAAAFDESTAFPLKSADTGATQVARVGADSDTLETLSDEIAAVKAETATIVADTGELQTNQGNWLTATGFSTHSAADVWAVGTRTLSSYGTLVADVAAAVWGAVSRTLTAASDSSGVTTLLSRIVGTLLAGNHTAQSGDAYARLGSPAGASTAADIAAVKGETATILADTNELQGNQGNWATATGFATPTNVTDATSPLATSSQAEQLSIDIAAVPDATEVQSAATAALNAYDPPTKSELDSAVSGLALEATLTAIKGATWTDETLEAIKTVVDGLEAGTAPTVEEIAAAVAAALATAHGSGAWGGAVGTGGTAYQWPPSGDPVVDGDGLPLDGVAVWITSDVAGLNVVAGPQYTLATGYVPSNWMLESGVTYYGWVQLARYNATINPKEFTVS